MTKSSANRTDRKSVATTRTPRSVPSRASVRRSKSSRRSRSGRKRRIFRYVLTFLLLIVTGGTIFFIQSYRHYAAIVDARLKSGFLTSRAGIYAAPRVLRAGQKLSPDGLIERLRRAGYVEKNEGDAWSGQFTRSDTYEVTIQPRRTETTSPTLVRVTFDAKGHIAELTGDLGVTLQAFALEPELLTTESAMKTGTRAQLSFREIPPVLVHAILSIEDRRFFEHGGVDVWAIGRALVQNAKDDETTQGGSTITQQLVKNVFLSSERTYRRKYAEAMTAMALEGRLSKEDIFALYCNEIYMGRRGAVNVRGVDQAARVYFGKDLMDLTLAESATLAGMIRSPNRYVPHDHPEAATARRNVVLGTMVRDGFITREEAATAAQEPVTVTPLNEAEGSTAPYFIDYVNRVVESRLTDSAGLRIQTTIDLDLQQLAEESIKRQLERLDKVYARRGLRPQAALVAIEPSTGNVLAMVGGRDYAESQLNRAVDARRQPGSVFKPIVYSAALEGGASPLELYEDAPQEFIYDGNSRYRPANYGGGFSMRNVTMRTALVKSLNVVTVDVAMRTGLRRVERTARRFGLPGAEPYPALALGTTEATPLEMAAAYTAFPNNGERVEPNVIERILDSAGAEVGQGTSERVRAVEPATAYTITSILEDVIDHGTARAARGSVRNAAIAGKTGTSRDGWFVGFTPNLVVAVWIGFDDNKQLGLTGAESALPAWVEFVGNAVELKPELGGKAFRQPAGINYVEIDPETGLLATLACPRRETIAIAAALAPNLECTTHGEAMELLAVDDAEIVRPRPPLVPQTREHDVARHTARHLTRIETNASGQRVLVNDMR